MIEGISDKDLEYSGNGGVAVGGFTWSMHFTWRSVPESEKKRRNSSVDSIRYAANSTGI